jgi:hypothetical protein
MNEQSPEYIIWQVTINRCATKPGHLKMLKADGTRGIKVCERWLNSFDNFLADMGPRPSPTHRLVRYDHAVDYTPENCRWAAYGSDGLSPEVHGMDVRTVRKRIRRGWTMEEALTIPQGGSRAKPPTKLT